MLHLLTLATVLASQAPAQPAPAEHPIAVAAKAFSACVRSKAMAAPTDGTAEAAADAVLAACGAEQGALDRVVQAQIASAPADQQAQAREQYRFGMAQARQSVVEALRARRSAATPTPSPTPVR